MVPSIFNICTIAFIVNLSLQDVCCHVNQEYVGCFLYSDDIVLISPLIIGLQQMLVACSITAKSFEFEFNDNKSHCLSWGKLINVDIGPMLFGNQSIAWCQSIKYLRVHLLSGKGLSFGITPIKLVFYASCNNIFTPLSFVLMKSSSGLTLFKKVSSSVI